MRPIVAVGIAAALAGTCCAAPGSATSGNGAAPRRIDVTAVPVALDPSDPKTTSLGDFTYAGGLALTSTQTRWLHELSDLNVTGPDRFAAVGDQGVLVEARFVLDRSGRLTGVADATIAW